MNESCELRRNLQIREPERYSRGCPDRRSPMNKTFVNQHVVYSRSGAYGVPPARFLGDRDRCHIDASARPAMVQAPRQPPPHLRSYTTCRDASAGSRPTAVGRSKPYSTTTAFLMNWTTSGSTITSSRRIGESRYRPSIDTQRLSAT